MFEAVDELALPKRSYPYSYQDLPLIKLFVYARIKGITAFQSLQKHLTMCPGVLALVGLEKAPHRKTLATRFRALSSLVLSLLHQLTERFMETGAVDPSLGSVDSTLMHAQGNVWHKQQRDQGELPSCGNIDTQAHWGKSGCGEWVYGYRLHSLTLCGPEGVIWPATVAVHAANRKDAEVLDDELVQRLPKATQVLLGDGGYDQESCTETAMNVKSPCSHRSRSKKHAARAARTSQALPRSLHPWGLCFTQNHRRAFPGST